MGRILPLVSKTSSEFQREGPDNWRNIPVFGRNPALGKDFRLESPLLPIEGTARTKSTRNLKVVPSPTDNMTKPRLSWSTSRKAGMFLKGATAIFLTLAGRPGNPEFAQAQTATS